MLADEPELIGAVSDMRWREWGHAPDPEDPQWWLATTTREAGRDFLPVTYVAVDSDGEPAGAVGLAEYDLEDWRDRSPWVIGMIVRRDRRRSGIGRALLQQVERWAADRDIRQLWVATGEAADFYRRSGWLPTHTATTGPGEPYTILRKPLTTAAGPAD